MLLRAAPLRGVARAAQAGPSRPAAAAAPRRVRSCGRVRAPAFAAPQSSDAAADSSEARRLLALQQYAELKSELLKNTALIGAGLAAYLTLAQHDGTSGASVAVGAAASLAYLALLCRHVDGLGVGAKVRGMKLQRNPGENIVAVMLGAVKSVGDVYWNALGHPQLLVPSALVVGCSAWNAADVGPDLQYIYVLVGFLSYKVAVLDQGYKALKAVTLYAPKTSDRPVLRDVPDITDKLY